LRLEQYNMHTAYAIIIPLIIMNIIELYRLVLYVKFCGVKLTFTIVIRF